MELSELVWFRHRLLAMCDYTGLIFKITPGFSHVFQRYAIADGEMHAWPSLTVAVLTAPAFVRQEMGMSPNHSKANGRR